MNDQAARALEASIEAWEHKLSLAKEGCFSEIETGASSCPLCQVFYKNNCEGCPVYQHTGEMSCQGTPYVKATSIIGRVTGRGIGELSPQVITAIEVEVEFLKSLREDR